MSDINCLGRFDISANAPYPLIKFMNIRIILDVTCAKAVYRKVWLLPRKCFRSKPIHNVILMHRIKKQGYQNESSVHFPSEIMVISSFIFSELVSFIDDIDFCIILYNLHLLVTKIHKGFILMIPFIFYFKIKILAKLN